jgi:hypothetical protein
MSFRPFHLLAAIGAVFAVSACTYVERERPPAQPATVVVPAPQQPATVVQPAPAPTVTVRPAY